MPVRKQLAITWRYLLILPALLLAYALVAEAPAHAGENSDPGYAPDGGCATWARLPSPNATERENVLLGVSFSSPDDGWTVGYSRIPDQNRRAMILRWNGSDWILAPTPHPAGTMSELVAVASISPTDSWAVGRWWSNSGIHTLTMHWDGIAWTIVPSPNIGSVSDLQGIAAIASNDIWAVGGFGVAPGQGGTLTMHWNGIAWTIVPSPTGTEGSALLWGVTAVTSTKVWAVGHERIPVGYGAIRKTFAMLWNGTQWNIVPTPNPNSYDNYLYAVDAIAANDVWAVGFGGFGAVDPPHTLTMHWDGIEWSVVPSPDVGDYGNFLYEVSAISSDDVWAVGFFYDLDAPDTVIALHWNGDNWTQGAPQHPAGYNKFYSVAALAPNNVWAVGSNLYVDPGANELTMVQHYSGPGCTPTPGPSRTPTRTRTAAATTTPGATNTQAATATSTSLPTNTSTPASTNTSLPTITPASTSTTAATSQATSTSLPTNTAIPTSTVAATVTTTPGACNPNFSDVQPSDYFYAAVNYLYCAGAISGYSDNTFRPYNTTTRGQLTKIVVLAEGWSLANPQAPTFSDVLTDHPFYLYIETASDRGIVTGYSDGTFRPGNSVTRGQLSKLIVSARGWPIDTTGGPHFIDVQHDHPFYPYIETALNHNVISGYSDGTFRPGNSATRGQIAKIVHGAITGEGP